MDQWPPIEKLFLAKRKRQGCTLSPLLLILSLEFDLNRLCSNNNIKVIEVHNQTYQLAAIADHVLLFLLEPHDRLPNLLCDLDSLHRISNLKVNYSKSQALNVLLPNGDLALYQTSFPFVWNPQAISYLDVKIPVKWSQLYKQNYLSILEGVRRYLKQWSGLNVSFFWESGFN